MTAPAYPPLGTTSPQAALASASARSRTQRRTCPECGCKAVERQAPTLARPLDPVGHCSVGCVRCDYRATVLTAEWNEATP